MNKIQFLISFVTIIPLFGAFSILFVKKNHTFISKFTMALAFIMLVNIINLCYNYDGNLNAISLIHITSNLDIGFSVTNVSLIIASIVTLVWFIITLYSNKYFVFNEDGRFFIFKLFSILLISLITLIIFSKNLITLVLFYQCLIFCLYFFNNYFSNKKEADAPNNFIFSLLTSSLFMFMAIFLTYKIAGNIEFINNGILEDVSSKKNVALLFLFILAICPICIFPLHILYKKLYSLNSPIMIMSFIISYGLASLLILLKIILNIFGFDNFIDNAHDFNFSYILNFLIGFNLLFSGILTVIQNNIKRILIYLFFNQLIFAFFLFLILNQSIDQFIITIISFILSQTLIFLCLGNINLYLLKSKEKILPGVFYKLRNTSILLLFAFGSLIGIAPSIGMVEKNILIRTYLINDFDFNLLIIFTNIILVLVSIIRVALPIFSKDLNINKEDTALAKRIDFDLSLMSPALIVAFLMFLSFIFSQSINNYMKSFLL